MSLAQMLGNQKPGIDHLDAPTVDHWLRSLDAVYHVMGHGAWSKNEIVLDRQVPSISFMLGLVYLAPFEVAIEAADYRLNIRVLDGLLLIEIWLIIDPGVPGVE